MRFADLLLASRSKENESANNGYFGCISIDGVILYRVKDGVKNNNGTLRVRNNSVLLEHLKDYKFDKDSLSDGWIDLIPYDNKQPLKMGKVSY